MQNKCNYNIKVSRLISVISFLASAVLLVIAVTVLLHALVNESVDALIVLSSAAALTIGFLL